MTDKEEIKNLRDLLNQTELKLAIAMEALKEYVQDDAEIDEAYTATSEIAYEAIEKIRGMK